MLRALWITAALACSGAPAPPPRAASAPPPAPAAPITHEARALDADLPRLVERSLVMYQDVGRALAASSDCGAVAGQLATLTEAYRDVVAANAKVLHDGRAPELRAALAPHGEAFDAAAQAIVQSPTMAKCAQDPAFARAFDQLLEPP